jgi:hypothetical protein
VTPKLRPEFEAAVVALAQVYDADARDVRAAARRVPPKRRGRKEKDDSAVVRDMVRRMAETGQSALRVAEEAVQHVDVDGASLSATVARLSRKARELDALCRRHPSLLLPPEPLWRVHQAFGEAADAVARERDRRAQLRIICHKV